MRAGPIAAGAWPAVLRPEMLPIPIIDEGIKVLGRGKDDVAAPAAITAVRAAELDEFLAAETHGAAASVTALQVDLALVEELHRNPEKKERRAAPLGPWRALGGAPTQLLPPWEGPREAPPTRRCVRPDPCGT